MITLLLITWLTLAIAWGALIFLPHSTFNPKLTILKGTPPSRPAARGPTADTKRNKEVIAKLSAAHQRFIAKLANSKAAPNSGENAKQDTKPSDNNSTKTS